MQSGDEQRRFPQALNAEDPSLAYASSDRQAAMSPGFRFAGDPASADRVSELKPSR